MLILGIESSCDETALALYCTEKGLVGHVLFSQVKLHAQYGGVVPELASREHIRYCIPLLDELLKTHQHTLQDLDGIAYTAGPGLLGALLVGGTIARALAAVLDIPIWPIHHLEGHLVAPFLEPSAPSFPHLALLVSGGHTMLIDVNGLGDYAVLGETLDDAAGEAFDKTAKLLGLGYPGGPALAKLAESGQRDYFAFPRPMLKGGNLDFSFSGLKTAVLHTVKTQNDEGLYAHIAASFEQAVVDTLVTKCKWALKATGHKQLVVSGGVSANVHLRQGIDAMAAKMSAQVFYPRLEFCTDNGAMIALAGAMRAQAGLPAETTPEPIRARWPLG